MARHKFTAQETAKVQDIRNNTRAKLVASLKSGLATMTGSIKAEIGRLNSDSTRPIYRVEDLAGHKVGADYLNAPENTDYVENEWPVQLGRLLQDMKQLERRILRVERSAKARRAA